MSQFPLSIAGLGMISCLGEGAAVNAAAMRCDYDGFQDIDFHQPYSAERQLGAPIESDLRGLEKLIYMSMVAVNEAVQHLPDGYPGLAVLHCVPDAAHARYINNGRLFPELNHMFRQTRLAAPSADSTVYWQHRCGFIGALKRAQELLYQKGHEYVLIITIDSLLNNGALAEYGGDFDGENRRLLGDDYSDGFIPGEAAAAVLLSMPARVPSRVIISGVGESIETATLDNEAEVLKGDGLANAIRAAAEQAQIAVHDTHYRVSSASGESYFFKEASLALSKALKQKVPAHQLLHPADSIGEVGAAIGGAMVVMDYFALTKGYAPGHTSLHLISNDNPQRGAYIMQIKGA